MKKCTRCHKDRELDDFSFRNTAAGIRNTVCKECHKKYVNKHYRRNKKLYLDRAKIKNRKVSIRNREYMKNALMGKKCVDCEEADIRVLEFDHLRDDKDIEVSLMVSNRYSLERIQREIDKCEVRCANCHRKITSQRANDWRQKAWLETLPT